jgi:hypothetical protein
MRKKSGILFLLLLAALHSAYAQACGYPPFLPFPPLMEPPQEFIRIPYWWVDAPGVVRRYLI